MVWHGFQVITLVNFSATICKNKFNHTFLNEIENIFQLKFHKIKIYQPMASQHWFRLWFRPNKILRLLISIMITHRKFTGLMCVLSAEVYRTVNFMVNTLSIDYTQGPQLPHWYCSSPVQIMVWHPRKSSLNSPSVQWKFKSFRSDKEWDQKVSLHLQTQLHSMYLSHQVAMPMPSPWCPLLVEATSTPSATTNGEAPPGKEAQI